MTNYFDIKEVANDETWNIVSDGKYCKKVIKQMLLDGMPEDATDDIVENGVKILGQCPNPNIKGNETKTGIVIGKVQSGKTSNFISTLALAFDNGYKLAVVLGGNKKNLAKQNTERLVKAFNSNDLVILNTETNNSLINAETINGFVLNHRKVIIVGLKHPTHINRITQIFKNTILSEYPTIIVDDEGDQATLNTKVYKEQISSTYGSVLELLKCINKNCFLSITATPQANILIKTCDILSPDFGELVYPGESYCGLEEFHGNEQDKFCKIISATEVPLLEDEGTPQSLYDALADFFVGGAIRRYRGDDRPHSMLIHPSSRVSEQKIVAKKVDNILTQWKIKARDKLNGIEDISYDGLYRILYNAYSRFKLDKVRVPEFDKLEFLCLNIIVNCSNVLQCNSEENASENAKFWSTTIFVGGNMVERGITIKGLAVTYITRRAKGKSNVDNTEQRARWFGYKRDFLDVCRVWMPQQIKEDYCNILEHDEDLWETIRSSQENGVPFKEIPRVFKLNNRFLRLTRANVAKTENLHISEWTTQKKFAVDECIAKDNTNIIEQYKNNLEVETETIEYSSKNKHRLFKDVDFNDFCENFINKIFFYDNDNLNAKSFSTLKCLMHKLEIENNKIDLLWMREGVGQERALSTNNEIVQLFQGRNPNKNSDSYYPGDRAMASNRSNKIQVQIHYVKPSNIYSIGYYCPVLALYVPPNLANKLSCFVTTEGGEL